MKKSGITLLLLLTLFVLGNAQTQSSTCDRSAKKDCREQHLQGKRDGQHNGINLFYRHHHQGKGHHQADGYSRAHYGKRMDAVKGRGKSTK